MPATPEYPTAENSSLRNTLSTSRCAIMLPAVARRSPAMTTPPSQAAATIVVPCASSATTGLGTETPAGMTPVAPAAACGSRSGAATVRKSVNDEVPALRYAPGSHRP
jgi:hypothetical protein